MIHQGWERYETMNDRECLASNVCCHNFTNCRFICWPFYDKNHMLISIFVANYPCIAVWKGKQLPPHTTATDATLSLSSCFVLRFIVLCDDADIRAVLNSATDAIQYALMLLLMLIYIDLMICIRIQQNCSFRF